MHSTSTHHTSVGNPTAAPVVMVSGLIQYGVPYEASDSDSDEEAGSAPRDEVRFSQEQFFSARVRELQRGVLTGGDPAAHTGLLSGFGPMLLHQTQSPHPERPCAAGLSILGPLDSPLPCCL